MFNNESYCIASTSMHFLNDIALDSSGNAYITDSFYGCIFYISYVTDLSWNLEEYVQSSHFLSSAEFGIDGITECSFSFFIQI